jgi:hypothetical protein
MADEKPVKTEEKAPASGGKKTGLILKIIGIIVVIAIILIAVDMFLFNLF